MRRNPSGGWRFRFAFESRQAIRIVCDRFGQNLQSDITIEPRIPRAIHLAHSTRAERDHDLVGAGRMPGERGIGVDRMLAEAALDMAAKAGGPNGSWTEKPGNNYHPFVVKLSNQSESPR